MRKWIVNWMLYGNSVNVFSWINITLYRIILLYNCITLYSKLHQILNIKLSHDPDFVGWGLGCCVQTWQGLLKSVKFCLKIPYYQQTRLNLLKFATFLSYLFFPNVSLFLHAFCLYVHQMVIHAYRNT